MNHYEQKQEEKRERLEAAAARARRNAESIGKTAMDRANMIPFGQPILVGHHSEKRDRGFRAKIQRGFERAHEETQRASELEQRAASVGTGGISQDDPEAVDKIDERVKELEATRDHRKKVNAAFRKAPGKDKAAKLAHLVEEGVIDEKEGMDLARFFALIHYEEKPYPAYSLTNIGANIRRLKQRAVHLAAPAPAADDIVGPGYVIEDNLEANRLQIKFDGKPAEAIRDELKAYGFRWSPSEKRWQRHRGYQARAAALVICERHYKPKAPDEPVVVQAAEPEPPGFKIPPPPEDRFCNFCSRISNHPTYEHTEECPTLWENHPLPDLNDRAAVEKNAQMFHDQRNRGQE